MKNKILLIIAILCMLVPFIVLGSVASAEVVPIDVVTSDFLIPSLDRGTWSGLWYFNMLSTLDNPAQGAYIYVSVTFTLVEATGNMLVFDIFSNTAYDVSSLTLRQDFSGGNATFVKAINGSSGSFDDSGTDGVIFYIPSSGVNVSYATNVGSLSSSIIELPQVSPSTFISLNNAYFDGYNFGVNQANNTVNSNSASYQAGYEQGNLDGFELGYGQGYLDGFDFGVQDGYQDGYSQGVTAGVNQANNTVNTNSASYIRGYQDGLDAPEYSFMSLIGAVLDAPIRAFFGYTDSNGVQHPGLFTLEILGFDMSAVILSIFTLCVIIVIIRMCLGGGK